MDDPKPLDSPASRWFIPVVLFLGTLLLIGVTLKDYGVTWDEPPYFHASDLHVRWISDFSANIVTGELRNSLDDQTIRAAWHWNPYNVPHPPFSRIVSGFAKEISSPFLDKFSAYRIGPALFFAVLVTVIYLWMKELFGAATGLFSALAAILTPNLFGFAHIAVTDLPLASMWFLTSYSFWKGLSNWKWSIVLGVIWGLALSTKFPAVLILIPLIVWAHLFHRDKYVNNLFTMLFLAPTVMVATQPYLWHQTGLRVLEFLYEGISRGYRAETNFGVLFFGQILPSSQLPWYYSFFMVGVTTPEPLVVLASLGVMSIAWRKNRRSAALLLFFNAVFILVLGVMPGAVLHDGVRQMLSVLPFLAALAGVGFHALLSWLVKFLQNRHALTQVTRLETKAAGILILLGCFSPFLDVYLCHPFQLSFYNRFVGGVRGAYARGLETTYFMEAFTPDFLRALNEKLPRSATVNASVANFMLLFYQKEGRLRPDIKLTSGESFDYYVILNRRTALGPRERRLINGPTKPFLAVDLADVPLILVFDFKTLTNPRR
jgi:Dolichyl-phosphate-mannose-protein mannosyltransferase